MQNFQELKLNPSLNASLIKMKFDTPTPIQIKSIPLILEKKDILASAQTGTGKTAAFCIPMIELIAQKKTKKANDPHIRVECTVWSEKVKKKDSFSDVLNVVP